MTELVLLAKRGDKQAFAALIERNKQSLYKIARSYFSEPMDIDDAVAETICLCWKNIGTLRKPEYFKTWLCRILINTCNKMRASVKDTVPLDDMREYEIPAAPDGTDNNDGFSRLMELAGDRYRLVLLLYYGEGFKISEISGLTGMPQGTVSSYLKRGREQLARRLKEEDLF